jgi:hypothetical protein
MTLAFTICSVNYLAQARTLGDSLRATNPHWQYVIGLVDDLDAANLPPELVPEYAMLEVARINIPDFGAMCDRYDITELNTAVKPFFIDYFYETRPDITQVIYFDPDIIVFQPLTKLQADLDRHSLVLTPHTVEPNPDELLPNDQTHLNTGIFNLGFIGTQRTDEARQFVSWWKERLVYECRIDLCAGLFVDQHWVNFAPAYCQNVHIETHRGYNVAYWNLHERWFSEDADGVWRVNQVATDPGYTLQFFHYSGYSPARPESVSKYQNRYDFIQRPDAWPLFRLYGDRLLANHNEAYRRYPCAYIKPDVPVRYQQTRRLLQKPLTRLIALLER